MIITKEFLRSKTVLAKIRADKYSFMNQYHTEFGRAHNDKEKCDPYHVIVRDIIDATFGIASIHILVNQI